MPPLSQAAESNTYGRSHRICVSFRNIEDNKVSIVDEQAFEFLTSLRILYVPMHRVLLLE